jgi:uncharacterized protein
MTEPVHAADLTDELEDWGDLAPPLGIPLGDPMPTRGLETWAAEGGTPSTGVWECEPGDSRWKLEGEGEFIHVVSGSMTCTSDDGVVTKLGPGDSFTFAPGWSGTWNIHETLRKVYTMFPA